MGRAYGILGVLLLVGCGSTKSMSFGLEAQAEVKAALKSPPTGDAALATGRAIYWIHGAGLAAERKQLVAALLAPRTLNAPAS